MSNQQARTSLRRIGALWKSRPGAKSLGTGTMTIAGMQQRFVVLKNTRKGQNSNAPDYVLVSSDEPKVDEYDRRQQRLEEPPVASQVQLPDEDDEPPF